MSYKLAILIPRLNSRSHIYEMPGGLKESLLVQKKKYPPGTIQILEMPDDGQMTIGAKRNHLMLGHKAKYHSFVDDDDKVHERYIDLLMTGIKTGADCCSLYGEFYQFDGTNFKYDRPFYHSLKYTEWSDDAAGYYRYPNHLNCVKTEKVKDILFPEKNFGEDHDWSKVVHSLKRLQTEAEIPVPFYKYYFKPQHLKKDLILK